MYFQSNLSRVSVNVRNIAARTLINNCDRRTNVRRCWTADCTVRCLSSTAGEENNVIRFSKEVEEARNENIPIVALESTIITHGMPYPDNLTTAIRVEEIIRRKVSASDEK